ncbi:dUTP diphosphatase [Xanthobacter dioxanivorans]|uniref:Deoxyuridine 5'-triphosphate nucleotidohydrolase n=1 Tax=Xanthobacter dioxanivorans TaxID=2528964 RepID=A0A974SL28_9HYPH|nr:dUTP diphosphatase [Xanthobacter dioxanivorans]QRG09460.1 dUTP diphosphatase [Xanthobacter dioxanivorans]
MVRIQRLPHAGDLPLPAYATPGAAGLDLVCAAPADAPVVIAPMGYAAIPTGFALALPEGYEGQVRPRSGLARNHGVTVLNAPGTVDSDYRGEVLVLLVNFGPKAFEAARGMRIAQLVVAPVCQIMLEESGNLSETARGSGGFGSTGLGMPLLKK